MESSEKILKLVLRLTYFSILVSTSGTYNPIQELMAAALR